jgi:chromosome partitioning protein
MPAIAFVSPKGGAGKTTAALLLALELAERGWRVAMIDSDPNKPLVHWAELGQRPERISVHPAPTLQDIPDALREAARRSPDWTILDTEGSVRGALAFTTMRLDLVLTPLAGSMLEANQAVKASQMLGEFGRRSDRTRVIHRCVLTRIPAAIRPRGLKAVVENLRSHGIELLDTPLIEKEAFRALFALGGGFDALEAEGIPGLTSARLNVAAFVDATLDVLGHPTRANEAASPGPA